MSDKRFEIITRLSKTIDDFFALRLYHQNIAEDAGKGKG